MANALVVYYSRKGENYTPEGLKFLEKGNTAYAAEYIAQALGADLFEVDTAKPYADGYRECCAEAVAEFRGGLRPEIKGYVADVSGYDTIFVCFPCWCGTAPMCVYTFLEHYDWTGKKVLPLCTNEGSGLANAPRDIAACCQGAIIGEGLDIKGHQVKDSEEIIAAWAREHV